MTTLSRSKIEYLDYVWNFYTGCLHWKTGVCPVPHCWARDMEKRFRGGDFEPHLRPEMLCPTFPKKPSRIGVCFTGDLFGEWVDIESTNLNYDVFTRRKVTLPLHIKLVVELRPKHQFLFLTKAPWNYRKWGEFPQNAWLGATVWDERSMVKALYDLTEVAAGHRWLSIEPMLAKVVPSVWIAEWDEISWAVIGAQSRPRRMPDISWVLEIVEACDKAGIPVWLKNNLAPLFKLEMVGYDMDIFWSISPDGKRRSLRQELPR